MLRELLLVVPMTFVFSTVPHLSLFEYMRASNTDVGSPVETAVPETSPDWWLWVLENDPELYALATCESGRNPDAINPMDGGSPSHGLLQWKESSFWYYNEKYNILPELERGEVMNVIYDPNIQIKMAQAVLEEPKGYLNWKNCFVKMRS